MCQFQARRVGVLARGMVANHPIEPALRILVIPLSEGEIDQQHAGVICQPTLLVLADEVREPQPRRADIRRQRLGGGPVSPELFFARPTLARIADARTRRQ